MFDFGYYTPVLILQAFCLYHAYKNSHEQKWFWIILFFPVIGGLIYLYHHFYSRRAVSDLTENLKGVFNSNYNIDKLEKEYRFNNSFANRVNLADAYVTVGRYADAVPLYQDCLKGFKADDPALLKKLLHVHFLNQDFEDAVQYGEKLGNEKSFKHAEERIAYAWALHYVSKDDKAKAVFEDMDKPYTNYPHRLEYGKFLREVSEHDKAKKVLTELYTEFEHMTKLERKQYADIPRKVKEIYRTVA